MSHSYRKPHSHIGQVSVGRRIARWYKRLIHGQERARLRSLLAHGDYDSADARLAPFNEWEAPRDGKFYVGNIKDASLKRKLLRK